MNNVLFQQARDAYSTQDYVSALEGFTEVLQGAGAGDPLAPGELGLLYHQIGNCLMKLGDYEEAIHAYVQATADSSYDGIGAVNCNLGNSYAALHDFENAVRHFEIAVSDAGYPTKYKAYSGMGKAYLKLGKSAEAGSAFRSAALDSGNPNPAQALLNLGICFMALNRPADAVASYESALQFGMQPATRNKLYANLGQAYTSCGQMQQAVSAFEMALADKTYFLNDAASVDYQRAVGAVAQGTAMMMPTPAEEQIVPAGADMSGLDVVADGAPYYADQAVMPAAQPVPDSPYYYADMYNVQDKYASGDERFFNATEEEIEQYSRRVSKQDRKRRNVGLKILIAIIVIVLVVAAAAVVAYMNGYGWPTQQAVAQQLFIDKNAAAETLFAANLDQDKVRTMIDPVVEDNQIEINGIERDMNSSIVYVLADTAEGGQVQYKITMSRDGIGWKISNVELYFPSQN